MYILAVDEDNKNKQKINGLFCVFLTYPDFMMKQSMWMC